MATPGGLHLTVMDNGHGLATGADGRNGSHHVPASLRRRARLLRARATADDAPDGGARIELRVRTKPWWKPSSWIAS